MPTYEYRCDKCGETFDVFQSFSARPLRRHAGCGGPVEKVFHPRGIVFKGEGFYVTDSRPKSSNGSSSESSTKKESSSVSSASSSSSSTSSSSSDE